VIAARLREGLSSGVQRVPAEDNPKAVKPHGAKIRSLRKQMGWTQEEMVERILALPRPRTPISKKTLENAESGRPVLTATLATIARALGTNVRQLMLSAGADGTGVPSGTGSASPAGSEPALHRDLFRVEAESRVDTPAADANLLIGVGFFRSVIEGVGGPTTPVFCGCASATVRFELDGAESRHDPCFSAVPANAMAKVEYGLGTAPSVRFEAVATPRLLDGRASVDLSVIKTKDDRLRVGVTIDPDWFSCYCPAKPELDGAERVVLDTILRKWWRPSIWDFEWGAGDAGPAQN
jgi:transcriptional regulator with XRE-family HTH domain